jgi:tetraprenyl-beta-curcumene synthase
MTATTHANSRVAPTTFLSAALRYWFGVFPLIRKESRQWRHRAEEIPDPSLRQLALEAQRIKRSNIEGSAALATFAPALHRGEVTRAQVAFQSVYDYVDSLAEQPNDHPVANARQLHQALLAAIEHSSEHTDYYGCHPCAGDGGYLEKIVAACRAALDTLPSRTVITESAHRLTTLISSYQSLNLTQPQGGHRYLEAWALTNTPPGTGLHWWETAAAAGSSLGVFALITAAAQPALQPAEAIAIERAYWPWVGALHSLLDSLIDETDDAAHEQQSLLAYYDTPQEAADRLEALARGALTAVNTLPHADHHILLLAAMASSYLASPEAASPTVLLARHRVIHVLGPATQPCLALLRVRHTGARIIRTHREGDVQL